MGKGDLRTRRGKIFLIPGDSPIGFRMPLGTLPYVPPSQYPYIHTTDPSIPRAPLPDFGPQVREGRAMPEASRKSGEAHRRFVLVPTCAWGRSALHTS